MANLKVLPLWSVPIALINFGEDMRPLNKDLIKDILAEADEHQASTRSGINAWQSEGGLETKYDSFATMAHNIKQCVFSMLPNIGFAQFEGQYDELFEVKELWANIIYKPGGFHIPHIHGSGETLFSGVYYPTSGFTYEELPEFKLTPLYPDEDLDEIPPNQFLANSNPKPGDLMLMDPAAGLKRQVIPEWVQRYPYYGTEFTLTPRQSMLIIFPNYIEHMVVPLTESNQMRMSISFCFTKRVGRDESQRASDN